MCKLFETISIIDGQIQNIEYHQIRFNESYYKVWNKVSKLNLSDIIIAPNNVGHVRAKFIYDNISHSIEYYQYVAKTTQSFKIVKSNNIDYSLKYLERKEIDSLLIQKDNCDEIIIVRNGLVTDTSIANIYFWDDTQWITPKQPLLKGTYRAQLLSKSKIIEKDIPLSDICKFKRIAVSNAMIGFREIMDFSISL